MNNAGTNWIAPAEEYPDAGWAKVMTLCIDGPFRLTREVGGAACAELRLETATAPV